MPRIIRDVHTDEEDYQIEFYKQLYGDEYYNEVLLDRSTDGHTPGILFEHKPNVTSYGLGKALSQAIVYLSRFNRDGVPVPKWTILVSQNEEVCYIYDNNRFAKFINNPAKYSNCKASEGLPGFRAGKPDMEIEYQLNTRGMKELFEFVDQDPEYIKVNIDEYNVYGWSNFYYDNAEKYKQKPIKNELFKELKKPKGTLEQFINPWKGREVDFKYIMDMLNDPLAQKKLGAFYTPKEYCKKATELVRKAIKRVPKGNDYTIIDRAAGGGNLEMYLTDEELEHVIISTYELKEWIVLKDRFGKRVKYIIPPIPKNNKHPGLNKEGFLSGANALERDIIDNKVVKKCIEDKKMTVILYENPPYIETTGIEFQKQGKGKKESKWKESYVVKEMKREVSGAATNDMGNAFIWSGFKYFLRQKTDSFVVFSPVKYWKAQGLVNKKFIEGYAFNREWFHAPTPACIMCALWSNEDDTKTEELTLQAFNIDDKNLIGEDRKLVSEGEIVVKKIHSYFSDVYYESNNEKGDVFDGIASDLDGTEMTNSDNKIRVKKTFNKNIVGYLAVDAPGFDSPRLHACLTRNEKYNGNGFNLRADTFVNKLPLFVASRYTDNCNNWKIMSLVMKSADGSDRWFKDLKQGKLDNYLCKCLIWTCLSHYPHLRSLKGSDGRTYLNELCFDGSTLASKELKKFIKNGYVLNAREEELLDKYKEILKMVKQKDRKGKYKKGFNPKYTYGLFQIDEEINLKREYTDRNGKTHSEPLYGDLNNAIKEMKVLLKEYYNKELVKTLYKYELLK